MDYLTLEEFANRLKLHPSTIRRAIKKGKIFAFQPGPGQRSPYRICESELERLQLQSVYEKKK